MGTRDPRVSAYIAGSAPFAKPILTRLRAVVHRTCPKVTETIKWGFPHFMYEGMLCSMASFTRHCAFGFWKGRLIVRAGGVKTKEAMGQFGRIEALADLPSKKLLANYVKQAMRINEADVASPTRSSRKPKPPVKVPADLQKALKRHPQACAVFEAFTPSNRREYVEWLTEAKTDETRARRLATAVEWMAEGKSRNWKYQNC